MDMFKNLDCIKEALKRSQGLNHGAIAVSNADGDTEVVPGNGEIILSEHYRAPINRLISLPGNVLVIGSPGSGKTYNVVLPNVMNMHGSYIVVDICGEVLKSTRAMLEENGYAVKVLNLSKTKVHSNQYNPFEYFRSKEDIEAFVSWITEEENTDILWKETEKSVITAAILCAKYYSAPECANFAVVKELLTREFASYNEGFKDGSDDPNMSLGKKVNTQIRPNDPNCEVVKLYDVFLKAPMQTRKNILVNASRHIGPFVDLSKGKLLDFWDTLDLENIQNKKMALFVIPDTLGSTESIAVTRAFFSQAYNFVMAEESCDSQKELQETKLPLYVLLDEAENIGTIPQFESILAKSKKYNTYTVLTLQDEDQLKALYPDNSHIFVKQNIGYIVTLFGKCQCKISYAGMSLTDRQAIATNELNARKLDR